MTNEQILELAENFKFCCRDEDDIRNWKVTPSLILEFARAIIEEHEKDREYNLGKDEYFNSWRN